MLGEALYLLGSILNNKISLILKPEMDVKGQAMGYRQGSYKPKGGLFHPRTQLIDALIESYPALRFYQFPLSSEPF